MSETKPARTVVNETLFLTTHERCQTYEELADQLGVQITAVKARSASYRKRGYELKEYPKGQRGRKLDVEAGNALLAKIRAEAE